MGRQPAAKNAITRNGDIKRFFKPYTQNSQVPRSSAPASSPSNECSTLTSPPTHPLLSSQGKEATPPGSTPRYGPDAVIQASDDEGDDSDVSLPDITATRQSPAPARVQLNACVTPKAKRTAMELFSSPLTIRQQKHKFDMKALLSHAETDNAAEAISRQVAEMLGDDKASVMSTPKKSTAEIQDHMMGLMEEGNEDDLDRCKLKRALERTEAGTVAEQWYFFKEYVTSSPNSITVFPVHASDGRWSFLADAVMRRDSFEQGIVQQALRKNGNLPDEIFLWVLDEITKEPNLSLRNQYILSAALCPRQIHGLVDEEAVCQLFQKLEARWESADLTTRLEMVPARSDPYPGRDWSHLRSVLQLISQMASQMNPEATICATKLLLRLAIDPLVDETMDILLEYQATFETLASSVPQRGWDDFVSNHKLPRTHELTISISVMRCAPRFTKAFRRQASGGKP
jgi:hypothetical protein